jgi:hypothetical protein
MDKFMNTQLPDFRGTAFLVVIAIAAIMLMVLLTGCYESSRTLSPATHTYTSADITAALGTSENPEASKLIVREEFHSDGTLRKREIVSKSGGSWLPKIEDFTGENMAMYVGIGLVLLGVASIWIPFLAPAKFIIFGLGGVFIIGGSFMKRDGFETLMFWLLAGGIVVVLAYLVFRYWSGLREVVLGVERGDNSHVKQTIHQETSHATDKIISGITK